MMHVSSMSKEALPSTRHTVLVANFRSPHCPHPWLQSDILVDQVPAMLVFETRAEYQSQVLALT